MKLFNIFLILMFIAGCGKDFEFSPKESFPDEAHQLKALYQEDVKLSIAPDAEPNKYWLKISWPKSIGPLIILENGKRLFKSTPNQSSFERLYRGGEKFEISLTQNTEEEVSYSQQIEIPEDLVISSSKTLTTDLNFKGGRVFITGTAKIQTLNFNLNFEVDEFHSENALIETFPQGSKANYDANGRSGGKIKIKTKKSSGHLFVMVRGEDGGDGKSSGCHLAFTVICNASSAGNGGDFGTFLFESEDSKGFELEINKYPGVGGAGGISCLHRMELPSILQLPRNSIILPGNNCEGHGEGRSNGQNGQSGHGEVCLKLNKVDKNACN